MSAALNIDDDVDIILIDDNQNVNDNSNNIEDDNDNNIHVNINVHDPQVVAELTLCPENLPTKKGNEFDDIGEVIENENKDEDEKLLDKLTYNDFDDSGMKIISFPHLKDKIEKNLCCKECVREHHRSYLTVHQTTYKLVTVLTFHCQYGHNFDVYPDYIDETKPYSSTNFKINICFVLAMQLLGKGLCTMSIFLGIVGI